MYGCEVSVSFSLWKKKENCWEICLINWFVLIWFEGHCRVGIIFVMDFVVIRIVVFTIITKQLNNTNSRTVGRVRANVNVTEIVIITVRETIAVLDTIRHRQVDTHHHVIEIVLTKSRTREIQSRINRKINFLCKILRFQIV